MHRHARRSRHRFRVVTSFLGHHCPPAVYDIYFLACDHYAVRGIHIWTVGAQCAHECCRGLGDIPRGRGITHRLIKGMVLILLGADGEKHDTVNYSDDTGSRRDSVVDDNGNNSSIAFMMVYM